MNRAEFEKLRDLTDKEINQNIIYRMENPVTLSFDNVPVSNSLGIDLVLNGVIKPDIPQYKFNFQVRGIGPICRVEVNGRIHKPAGRTHKHDLQKESCPRLNLPRAVARPDLEAMSVEEVWEAICRQARIKHLGKLIY
jgi:hypothetical protein